MLFSTESLAGAAAAQRANKLGDQPFALIHLPAPPPATICQGLFSVIFLEYSHITDICYFFYTGKIFGE